MQLKNQLYITILVVLASCFSARASQLITGRSEQADTVIRSKTTDIQMLGSAGYATGIGALWYDKPLAYTYENNKVNGYDISDTKNITLKASIPTGNGVRNITSVGDKLVIIKRDTKSGGYDSFYPYYANLFESGVTDIQQNDSGKLSSDDTINSLFKSVCVTYKLSDITNILVRKAYQDENGKYINSIVFTYYIEKNKKKPTQVIEYLNQKFDSMDEALEALKSTYKGNECMETILNHDFFIEIDWDAMDGNEVSIDCSTLTWNENGAFDQCKRTGNTSIYYGKGNSPAIYEGCAHIGVSNGSIELRKSISQYTHNEISLLLKTDKLNGEATIPVMFMGDETRSVTLKENGNGYSLGLTNGKKSVSSQNILKKGEWYNLRIVLSNNTLFLRSRPKELPDNWTIDCSLQDNKPCCEYIGIGLNSNSDAEIEIDNFFYDNYYIINNTYRKGLIYIVDKQTNSIENTFYSDLKCSEVSVHENTMIVTCLSGINFYDISDISHLKLIATYRRSPHEGWFEAQGSSITEINGHIYHITSTYLHGIIIHDITDKNNINLVANVEAPEIYYEAGRLKHVTFDICTKGSKAYQTVSTTKEHEFTESDNRGIIVWDLSNINAPTHHAVYINDEDRDEFSGGDPVPNRIDINDNFIVCNNNNKGMIVYSIDGEGVPEYEGCVMPADNPSISSVCATEDYLLMKGEKLYVCKFKKMKPRVEVENIYSNGISIKGVYQDKDEDIDKCWLDFDGNIVSGCIYETNNLEPESQHTVCLFIQGKDGTIESDTAYIKLPTMVLEAGNAVTDKKGNTFIPVATNMFPDTPVGIEAKRTDSTEPTTDIECNTITESFYMASTSSLDDDGIYLVTPYYINSEGNKQYGTPCYITPSDTSAAAPFVSTLDEATVRSNAAIVKGMAIERGEEIKTAGFEFRLADSELAGSMEYFTDSIHSNFDTKTIRGKLTNLFGNTEYLYRIFVTTDEGNTYGVTRSFTTGNSSGTTLKQSVKNMTNIISDTEKTYFLLDEKDVDSISTYIESKALMYPIRNEFEEATNNIDSLVKTYLAKLLDNKITEIESYYPSMSDNFRKATESIIDSTNYAYTSIEDYHEAALTLVRCLDDIAEYIKYQNAFTQKVKWAESKLSLFKDESYSYFENAILQYNVMYDSAKEYSEATNKLDEAFYEAKRILHVTKINATITEVEIDVCCVSATGSCDIKANKTQSIWWTLNGDSISEGKSLYIDTLDYDKEYVLGFHVTDIDGYTGSVFYTFTSPKKEEIVGINSVYSGKDETDKYPTNNYILDMSGRYVEKPVKGRIYIINGKKIKF